MNYNIEMEDQDERKSIYDEKVEIDLKEEFIINNNRKTKQNKVNYQNQKKKKPGFGTKLFNIFCSCFRRVNTNDEVNYY